MIEHNDLPGNATNVNRSALEPLVAAAKRHNMPVIAVMVATPAPVCVERQGPRPANRAVPADTVRTQHKAMVQSHPTLLAGGFNEVVFADSLYELLPYLERLSAKRTADVELDGGEGLGDLLLVRRAFGPEILPLWRRQGRLQRPWRRPRCGDPPRQNTVRENRPRPSRLDPYKPYLERRFAAGCTSVTQLHGELLAEHAPSPTAWSVPTSPPCASSRRARRPDHRRCGR
jgi:hypothetical protein